jgi:hypothetical protein
VPRASCAAAAAASTRHAQHTTHIIRFSGSILFLPSNLQEVVYPSRAATSPRSSKSPVVHQ